MTYRKAMTITVIMLICTTAYDIWWVVAGKLPYIPGIYPTVCILVIVGLRLSKKHGLWDEPPKHQPGPKRTLKEIDR